MKAKILADFQICISVLLKEKRTNYMRDSKKILLEIRGALILLKYKVQREF